MHDSSTRGSESGTLRSFPPSGPRDAAELRLKIDEKRERLTRTAEAIEQKLSPDRVLRPLVQNVKEAAVGSSSTLVETLKENPVAMLLAAVGLGWLMVRPRRSPTAGGEESSVAQSGREVAQKARGAAQGVKEAVLEAGEKVGEWTQKAGAEVHHLARSVKRGSRHARQWLGDTADSRPLLLGAAALSLGFLAVMVVPRSRGEEEFFARVRSRLLGESGAPSKPAPGPESQDDTVLGLAPDEEP